MTSCFREILWRRGYIISGIFPKHVGLRWRRKLLRPPSAALFISMETTSMDDWTCLLHACRVGDGIPSVLIPHKSINSYRQVSKPLVYSWTCAVPMRKRQTPPCPGRLWGPHGICLMGTGRLLQRQSDRSVKLNDDDDDNATAVSPIVDPKYAQFPTRINSVYGGVRFYVSAALNLWSHR
jgi:hypothetical protein